MEPDPRPEGPLRAPHKAPPTGPRQIFSNWVSDSAALRRLILYVSQRLTLQDIFVSGVAAFLRTRRLPLFVHKAAKAILHCRTAVLGGHVMACPEGHVEKVFYNSCGHRACPKCAFLKTEQWLQSKRDKLLACDHIHFTFMLPPELYPFWPYNYKALADLLFRSVRETLFELLGDPRHLGALPGFYMALHTWSRALGLYPHLHVLVTVGGLAPDGTWKKPRRQSLLSTDDPKRVFKEKFCRGFKKLLDGGKLQMPADINDNDAEIRRQKALCRRWIVNRGERYKHGRGVLAYFARYGKGGPLKESRLLAFDGETVTFRQSRRHEPFKAVTLPADIFIERVLRHVPPHNFRTLRACGLYAPNAGAKLQMARVALDQPSPSEPHDQIPTDSYGEASEGTSDDCCPVCGRKLVLVDKIPRPPPARAGPLRAAA